MDKYIFLITSLYLLIIWGGVYLLRRDLRQKLIKTSVWGGIMGLISEFWYFRDYWQPPSLFGQAIPSIEDFLFGFAAVGVMATIFDVILKKRVVSGEKRRKDLFLLFFIAILTSLLVFTSLLKINSLLVSCAISVVVTILMIIIRKDLLSSALISGLLSTIIIIPLYFILFKFISPDYFKNYWLLYQTKFGLVLFNCLPLSELITYFYLGCLLGIGYEFASGKKKVKL